MFLSPIVGNMAWIGGLYSSYTQYYFLNHWSMQIFFHMMIRPWSSKCFLFLSSTNTDNWSKKGVSVFYVAKLFLLQADEGFWLKWYLIQKHLNYNIMLFNFALSRLVAELRKIWLGWEAIYWPLCINSQPIMINSVRKWTMKHCYKSNYHLSDRAKLREFKDDK